MIRSFLILCLLALSAATFAQTAPSTPATSVSLPPGPMKIKITGVEGIVQARTAADQKWTKATQGLELTEGAELRTGPHSAVQFMIGDDQTITLDRLGVIQILRANFESGKVFTDLGMKYGRTRYDIDSAGREHDAKVRSPSSVLAVRGTIFSAYDQPPFAPTAVSLDGRVMFRDVHKEVGVGNKKQGKTKIDTDHYTPAEMALADATEAQLPQNIGQTMGDSERVANNLFGAKIKDLGVLSLYDQYRLQGHGSIVAVIILEQLQISANWTGAPGSDVDLSVVSPQGELLDAAHPFVPSRGVHEGNTVADQTGVGLETARWTDLFPSGKYTITTALKTPGSVNVLLDVIRDPFDNANDNANLATPQGNSLAYTLDQTTPSKTISVQVTGKVHAAGPSATAITAKRRK